MSFKVEGTGTLVKKACSSSLFLKTRVPSPPPFFHRTPHTLFPMRGKEQVLIHVRL